MNYNDQLEMIQAAMSPDVDKIKLLLYRLEFQVRENLRQPAEELIETLGMEKKIPEIIQLAGEKCGGGAYRVDLVMEDRVLSSQPFKIAGKPKSEPPQFQPRKNIFEPIVKRWHDKDAEKAGASESVYFDDKALIAFWEEFKEHGVDDFLDFLDTSGKDATSTTKFLIECLHKAQNSGRMVRN